MVMGSILTLDLSGVVGWAFGPISSDEVTPLCGAWVLPKVGGLGAKMAAFENELMMAIDFHQPTHIVMEAPLPAKGQASTMVALQQFGLAAMTECVGYRFDIQVQQVAASTVRKDVIGTGRFTTGTAKAAVMAYCQSQGWKVPDHNAADACITLKYAARKLAARERLS